MLRSRPFLIFVLDAMLIGGCVLGFVQTYERAGLPYEISDEHGELRLIGTSHPLSGLVRTIDGHAVATHYDIDFLLDAHRIGDEVQVGMTNGIIPMRLVRWYSSFYLFTQILVTAIYFAFGIFVYRKRPEESSAFVAHWLAVTAALLVAVTWGSYTFLPLPIATLLRWLFCIGASFTPVLLVHFALTFPVRRGDVRKMLAAVYAIATITTIACGVTSSMAIVQHSLSIFHYHLQTFRLSQTFFVIATGWSALIFLRSYRTGTSSAERQKVKWALLGVMSGVVSYIVLWSGPQLMGFDPLVPESVLLLMVAVAPVAFTISIVRHRLFDIDTVLNRATVYAIVLAVLVSGYGLVLWLSTLFVSTLRESPSLVILSSVLLAVLFQPLRQRVQHFVDKRFFHVRYNFREAQKRMFEAIGRAGSRQELLQQVVASCHELLQPEFARVENDLSLQTIEAQSDALELGVSLPWFKSSEEECALRLPLAESGDYVLSLGRKRSRERYSIEDIDLLNSISVQTGLALERIALEERIIEERVAAEHEREIGRLKTLFVSSISHDLKSPITSIRMFAELLEAMIGQGDATALEYLRIIEGESDRLTGLIDNVLTFSRIERGMMLYDFERVNLVDIMKRTLGAMDYLFKLEDVKIEICYAAEPQIIQGDHTALERVLNNLISNAIKYSDTDKRIELKMNSGASMHTLSIRDYGRGIQQIDLAKIFEPFYRSSATARSAAGVGLGLATVKHVVEAHRGSIAFESEPGKGTTVQLSFPRTDLANTLDSESHTNIGNAEDTHH